MAKEIRIAEIPIYGMSEESFTKKWEAHIKKSVDQWEVSGWDRSEADREYRRLVFPRSIWKYAQVIGYLTIDVSATDVLFEVFAPIKERYSYNMIKKVGIQCWQMNGTHFPVERTMDNAAIRREVYKWIELIKVEHLKKYYLDLTVFDAISDHLDYRGIIEKLRR